MIGKEWGIVTKYLTFSTGAKNATYTVKNIMLFYSNICKVCLMDTVAASILYGSFWRQPAE